MDNETINNLISNFRKRNFDAFFFEDKAEATNFILSEFNDNKTISWGGSLTLNQLEIKEKTKERNLNVIDRDLATSPDERHKMHLATFGCDYYLMSSNAVTQDGKLINIDGIGNRVAALIYGPSAVYVIVGINKICKNEKDGIDRVRNMAAPKNAKRLNRATPCAETGFCHNCLTEQCICSHIVITRRSWIKGRIKIIVVNETMGI